MHKSGYFIVSLFKNPAVWLADGIWSISQELDSSRYEIYTGV